MEEKKGGPLQVEKYTLIVVDVYGGEYGWRLLKSSAEGRWRPWFSEWHSVSVTCHATPIVHGIRHADGPRDSNHVARE